MWPVIEYDLKNRPVTLIIDEVQQAPKLFDVIEAKVNERKFAGENNYGMYVLAGSQAYRLTENVSDTMAGRVGIVRMNPLSMSEINGQKEEAFIPDIRLQARVRNYSISVDDMYRHIVRGFFPELYEDYTATYIERDGSQAIHLKDHLLFQNFMEIPGSLTGEELVYDTIAKSFGVTVATVKSWISVLAAGNVIGLLQPCHENSIVKRIVKRPKLYLTDTGLACWLARLNNEEVLKNSIFNGRFVETYIINEIRKSYTNNGIEPGMYCCRDTNQNEIDLVNQDVLALPLSAVWLSESDVKSISRYDIIVVRKQRRTYKQCLHHTMKQIPVILLKQYSCPEIRYGQSSSLKHS